MYTWSPTQTPPHVYVQNLLDRLYRVIESSQMLPPQNNTDKRDLHPLLIITLSQARDSQNIYLSSSNQLILYE